ncbi:MAG: hypothetical protein A4E62_03027 [Syntrophorhabdus sp. PtaU1.Bin002]|nr:MAG: hypothetical protein A4E62_03027 [Syntrophorhabdus sp. PtaU1.Bin002]
MNSFPPYDRSGITTHEDRKCVLGLSDLGFYLGDRCCGCLILRAGLLDSHLRHLAIFETQFENSDRLGVGLQGPFRYHELFVKTQELNIGTGHRGNQGKDHTPSRLLSGEECRPGSLRKPPYAAPEIDLPTRACKGLVRSPGVRHKRKERRISDYA